jgi:CheY-like chemotaxis protein
VSRSKGRELEGLHLLVVDDNDDAREILRAYLTYCGAMVTTARSGHEALTVLQEIRVHVIISDLSMPGLDGHDFLRRVRELPGEAEHPTPAIAITGFAGPEHRQRALASGFSLYVVKPVDPSRIVEDILALAHGEEPRPPEGA